MERHKHNRTHAHGRNHEHNHRHEQDEHEHKHEERLGPGGFCVCPKCGKRIPHKASVGCQEEKCPNCGAKMLREGSYHHRLFEKKKKSNEKS